MSDSSSSEDEGDFCTSRPGGQLGQWSAIPNGHVGSPSRGKASKGGNVNSERLDLSTICRDEEDTRLLARLLKCNKGKEVVAELEEKLCCKLHIKYKTRPKRRLVTKRPRSRRCQSPQVVCQSSPRLFFGGRSISMSETPEYRSTSSIINNVEVKVKQGDIAKETADVIVNVVGPDLDFQKSLISKSLCKAGGSTLIKALKDSKSKLGSSRIITTVGGNLNCQFVFTLVLHPWTDVNAQKEFPQIMDECFQLCIQSGMTSISLPLLGCGRMLQYPLQTAADIMVQSACKALSKGGLQGITFVQYSPPEYDAMTQALRQNSGATGGTAAANEGDSDDVDAIGCSITVSTFSKTRPNVVSRILSGIKDRLLCTDNIQNPQNKCLPLRIKGRIHEVASKKGQRHIRLDIDQKTGNIELRGERDHIKKCKYEIIPLLSGTVNTSDQLKCSPEFWSSLAHEYTQTPPYWSHFPRCRPMPEVFKLFQANRQPMVVPVDRDTDAAVRSLVHSTWQKENVGQGRDAVGLSHTSLKIHKVERIENLGLFAKYAIKRQEFFRALSDDETYHLPKIEDVLPSGMPMQCRGPIDTYAKLTKPLKEEIFPEINEHYLFHGTKPEVLQTIIHQGLDFRMSSDKAMFGMGIYGAESSTKADQYVDAKTNRTPGTKKMLLMRMLLGKSYLCLDPNPKKYRRPPCTSSGCRRDDCVDMHDRFDSVIGDGQWLFREFVVYAVDQCYPEYIITYERK
ncbi:uncharacterized protein LOC133173270 isoform X2 [Saccostrea echinata]|uniref:uncharacterized protein LOC133173270 isoform X2 n=1 Tax=Saccostrea echinata TaxID=191078 RepID=UPI002A815561|nr:uncharacterized protein LOC133173270 isoform X2 [Saccostrea echinata]